MRLVRLSKDVYGFDTLDGCIAYFKHVLPWQKGRFNIVGEGYHISSDGLSEDEIVIFSYDGKIVSIAKSLHLLHDNTNKAIAIMLKSETQRVFDNPPTLKELQSLLLNNGYRKKIVGVRGWNIIDDKLSQVVISFLVHKEWKDIMVLKNQTNIFKSLVNRMKILI